MVNYENLSPSDLSEFVAIRTKKIYEIQPPNWRDLPNKQELVEKADKEAWDEFVQLHPEYLTIPKK